MAINVYQIVTDRILAELENGRIPWEKPWTGIRSGAYSRATGKPYSVLNQMLLQKPGEYLTYKQAQEAGGSVRKGEKSQIVVFWKPLEVTEKDQSGKPIKKFVPLLKYFYVFHIDQCDGVKPKFQPDDLTPADPIHEAEAILADYSMRSGCPILHNRQDRAFYRPSTDEIPELSTASEAAFAIRQADKLSIYGSWRDVLKNIEHIDDTWAALQKALNLDSDFVKANQAHILPFLMEEGASIAMDYENSLAESEGFHRIVRALLMGQYHILKYFRDDLNREINYTITETQKSRWMENKDLKRGAINVAERDDFFSTMRIGEVPQRTCLHYKNGVYRGCLLSCFDSNKKFLCAMLNGKMVARAMLRLTKGHVANSKKAAQSLEFADLRTDVSVVTSPKETEELVLFLERSYTSGINEEQIAQINQMFVELTTLKAQQLNAVPVLSQDYCPVATDQGFVSMAYTLYISRSKAGQQYLDSLGGANGVSSEGSYKSSLFLLSAK